jgi:hypothetical protein
MLLLLPLLLLCVAPGALVDSDDDCSEEEADIDLGTAGSFKQSASMLYKAKVSRPGSTDCWFCRGDTLDAPTACFVVMTQLDARTACCVVVTQLIAACCTCGVHPQLGSLYTPCYQVVKVPRVAGAG